MSFIDNWSRDRAGQEAQRFLTSGKVSNTGNAIFSNIDSGRVGCVDSSDCASGWRCSGGYCISPQNNPASGRQSSINDQGCGSDGDDGGGGGPCAASTGGSLGSGGCVKTGCGQQSNPIPPGSDKDCCGDTRCCRYDQFGVRCQCGDCPPDDECDKFCAAYRSSIAEGAPGCSSGTECDECTNCELFAFQGTKNIYKCKPKSGGPCWCEESDRKCTECYDCADNGSCYYQPRRCQPVNPPKEDPPEENPCIEIETYNSICTEIGGPRTSAGSCRAGGGRVTGSWNSSKDEGNANDGGDFYECVGCIYTDRYGDCDPEPCDCNCDNDCAECEICNADGECVPDPTCTDGTFTAIIGAFFRGGYVYQSSCSKPSVGPWEGCSEDDGTKGFYVNDNVWTTKPGKGSFRWVKNKPNTPLPYYFPTEEYGCFLGTTDNPVDYNTQRPDNFRDYIEDAWRLVDSEGTILVRCGLAIHGGAGFNCFNRSIFLQSSSPTFQILYINGPGIPYKDPEDFGPYLGTWDYGV